MLLEDVALALLRAFGGLVWILDNPAHGFGCRFHRRLGQGTPGVYTAHPAGTVPSA